MTRRRRGRTTTERVGPPVVGASVVGAILAGGRATRFGGAPKGLERVGGVRIVDRVASALRSACDDLVLVSSVLDASTWLPGVRVVCDVYPDHGALGALHAALHAALSSAPDAAVLVVAWDMPFVPAPLLVALRDEQERAGADAAVPLGTSGRAEPLCACYGPACLGAAERLLVSGERRASLLGESVHARWLDASSFGDPDVMFLNVNSPADLTGLR